jgi:CheY-like chemotaxis protein
MPLDSLRGLRLNRSPYFCALIMSKMILIAEDDENDAKALVDCLQKSGAVNPITLVGDGKDVIAYFKGEGHYKDRVKYPQPSILLLDLKMPRLGGFEVLEWLHHGERSKGILIIILTGYELGNIRRGYELGARSFLPKPCSVDDIQNLIRTYPTYWEIAISGASKNNDRRAPISV